MSRFLLCLTLTIFACAAVPDASAAIEGDKVKKGLAMMKAGNFEGALAKFRDAQIEHPSSNELHFNIGMALYKLDRYEEARAAFENATSTRNAEIEKKALFHIGNCFVKEGKLEQALDSFNRALEVDENFDAAKVNREYVVRKMKEVARKQKKQQEQQKQERKIIEKLQELLTKEVQVHAALRARMKVSDQEVAGSKLKPFAKILDEGINDAEIVDSVSKPTADEFFKTIGGEQATLHKELGEIITEVATKIEDGKNQPNQGPAGAAPQPNPEVAKLEKALPFLQSADPRLDRAREALADEQNFAGAHAAQELAIQDLLDAINELLDELARLIKEESELLSDSYAVFQKTKAPQEKDRPHPGDVKADGERHASRQGALRERTERFTKGLEAHIGQMRQEHEKKMQPGGPGVQPGEDPMENVRRMEKALTHLNAASGAMEEAEAQLKEPDFENAVPKEQVALRELVMARRAMSPPQQQNSNGQDQQKQDKENDGQKGEEQKQEEEKDGKGQEGNEGEPEQKDAKKQEAKEISEEQAKKTLDQQKQREMDRRRERKAKDKKARRGKGRGVKKDW